MRRADDGTWAVTGEPSWLGRRYRYEVTVFTPHHHRVVANQVTDPYSQALTVNSTHSVLIDIDDPGLAPEIWRTASAPILEHPVDQVSYELHLRDFSISDSSVPKELRLLALARTRRWPIAPLPRAVNTVNAAFDNATVEISGSNCVPEAG